MTKSSVNIAGGTANRLSGSYLAAMLANSVPARLKGRLGVSANFPILVAAATGVAMTPRAAAATAPPPYNWSTVPWGGGGYVDGFAYHPKVKDLLYTRTDVGGVYRFDFAARCWIPLLDSLPHADGDMNGILSVALDPNDANKVYLACGLYLGDWAHNGAILRSDDQGASWAKTDLPFKLGGNADGRGTGERLQVDPNSGNILFLGSNQNGLWKSTDGAKSFAKVGGFPRSDVTLVLFDPASAAKGAPSQTIYVGSGEALVVVVQPDQLVMLPFEPGLRDHLLAEIVEAVEQHAQQHRQHQRDVRRDDGVGHVLSYQTGADEGRDDDQPDEQRGLWQRAQAEDAADRGRRDVDHHMRLLDRIPVIEQGE